MSLLVKPHIEKTPGICGGKVRIAGHRIRVLDVAILHERRGLSPEEIVGQYPGLTLADVHAALSYYFDNRHEIEEEIRHEAEVAEQLKARFPSKVQEKLRG